MAGVKAWITVVSYLSPHLQPVVSLSEDVVKPSQTLKHPVASPGLYSPQPPPPPPLHTHTHTHTPLLYGSSHLAGVSPLWMVHGSQRCCLLMGGHPGFLLEDFEIWEFFFSLSDTDYVEGRGCHNETRWVSEWRKKWGRPTFEYWSWPLRSKSRPNSKNPIIIWEELNCDSQ